MGCCGGQPVIIEEEEKKDVQTICVITWNVNAKPPTTHPPQNSLSSLLLNPRFPSPDIYIIGLEEIVDLNVQNLLKDNNKAGSQWTQNIQSILPSMYIKLAVKHLMGILLLIFAKKTIAVDISNIMAGVCGAGLLGTGANKGGVSIRFNLFQSQLSFICCHLAAHKKNVKGRNADFHQICSKLKYESSSYDDSILYENKKYYKNIGILDHDFVFWFGDINYRLDFDKNDLAKVYSMIEDKEWRDLCQNDQLLMERAKGNAFLNFRESEICFPPTFKYLPGSSEYDKTSNKKKPRMPSYCDRILWRVKNNMNMVNIKCVEYGCSMEQIMSDHKPVYAWFEVECKKEGDEDEVGDNGGNADFHVSIQAVSSQLALVVKGKCPSPSASSASGNQFQN